MNSKIAKHDLHVHTTYSDGEGTPEMVIDMAKNKNVDILGISDHCFTLKLENIGFPSVNMSNIQIYYNHLKRLQEKNDDIKLLIGIEIDVSYHNRLMDPSDLPFDVLNKFDYALFENVDAEIINEIVDIRNNLVIPVGLAHNNLTRNWFMEEEKIVNILGKNDIYLELNTGYRFHFSFSDKLINALKSNDVKVAVGTDSHRICNIGMVEETNRFIHNNGLNIHEFIGDSYLLKKY